MGGHALLAELEHGAIQTALGGGEWVPKLHAGLMENLGRYRKYKADEVRDLLRVIRNKMNHFRELPAKVQEEVGAPPDNFYAYFASRFPGLLLHAYRFALRNCAHESQFRKFFFPQGSEGSGSGRKSGVGGGMGVGVGGGGIELTVGSTCRLPPVLVLSSRSHAYAPPTPPFPAPRYISLTHAHPHIHTPTHPRIPAHAYPPTHPHTPTHAPAAAVGGSPYFVVEAIEKVATEAAEMSAQKAARRAAATAAAPPVEYPERPGAPECAFYVKTGRCKFGAGCKFHHPAGMHD